MKDRLGSSANSTVTWQRQEWHRSSATTTNTCWSCDARELEFYHLDLPVDVPLLHVAEAPGFDRITSAGIHPDQTVVGDANQLVTLPTLEPVEKRSDALSVMKMSQDRDDRHVLLSSLTWQENEWFRTRAETARPGWSASLLRWDSSGPRSGGLQGSGLKSDQHTTDLSVYPSPGMVTSTIPSARPITTHRPVDAHVI